MRLEVEYSQTHPGLTQTAYRVHTASSMNDIMMVVVVVRLKASNRINNVGLSVFDCSLVQEVGTREGIARCQGSETICLSRAWHVCLQLSTSEDHFGTELSTMIEELKAFKQLATDIKY